MKTKRKMLTLALAMIMLVSTLCILASRTSYASAEELDFKHNPIETVTAVEAEPLGLYTLMSLSIDSHNGQVIATAKNDISIFAKKVTVYVYLYSSLSYQESYNTMTIESSNYIEDLDKGKTLSTYANINGVKRYWQARLYYKSDNGKWKEKLTDVWLIDVDGTATKA